MTLLVTSLASGSDANALLLRQGRAALLIDCGLPLRHLEPLLRYAGVDPADVQAVVLTHEHGDHTLGAGALARRYGMPVVCNSETRAALSSSLKHAAVEELPPGQQASVGPFELCSFAVPHDAAAPVGYTITASGATVGLAIDLGSWTPPVVEHLRRADLLVVEANHQREKLLDGPYPWSVCQRIVGPRGHLDNTQAGDLLAAIGADGRWRDVRLAHLSEQTNRPAFARKVVQGRLAAAGITCMQLGVLPRRATPTRKGMAFWSSDSLFRQQELFG
jgi:phosphoribosyl 1,2-cyclic phosphodiesterase